MPEVPIRTTSGEIGCPKCKTPLRLGKAPFYLHGEHVGNFESLICPICNYSTLTSSGYQEATVKAKQQSLIGPEEKFDVPEFGEVSYLITKQIRSKMRQHILKSKKKLNDKSFTDESDNDVREITDIHSPLIIHNLTKTKVIS